MRDDTFKLMARVLLIAVFIAAISALCEVLFVLIMKGFNPAIQFTGAYAVVVFSAFCGIIPFWPTPSKLSNVRLDLRRRALIFAETGIVVIVALFVFIWAQNERAHEAALIGLLSYLFVALIFFAWRWKGAQGS